MEKKDTISRKQFAYIFMAIGVLIVLPGIILHFVQIDFFQGLKNVSSFSAFLELLTGKAKALKNIYDLPQYMMLIGSGFFIYGLFQLFKIKHLGNEISISRKHVKDFLLNNAILFALLVMIVVIACIEPRFMQMRVLRDILAQSSPKLIIALGICFTLLIGGTDLSAGRMVGLAAVISASMMQTETYGNRFFPELGQVPIILPVLLAILACLCFGAFNGVLVAKFDMHPFIATLSTQVIVYGACSLYFDMPPNNSQPIGGIRKDFANLGQLKVFDSIPILIFFALAVTIIIWFILNKTVFGKNVYAIGGNRQAAIVSGVNVPLTIVGIFMLASFLYAIGGVLEAARTAGATNAYGNGYELDAIAACVVGGVSLNGGVGKVRGIVIGVLIFTVIQYGLTFINVNPQWQQVIKGLIIAVAVAIDLSKYRKR